MGHITVGTSLAHTYGNVTSIYTDLIKGLFPDNYFKTVHIASKTAFREFNIFQNKNKEYFKKSKPMLIVRPRVDINNNDEFLKGSYLTTQIAGGLGMDASDNGNLQLIMADKDKGKYLKYLMNRMSMNFDVSIIVESQMQQLNLVTYLKNKLMTERPMMVSAHLENNIPRELMDIIAKDTGFGSLNENNTQNFLDYMNTHSIFPITYKMKNSTGNDEFFRYYPVNIDTVVSPYEIDDGSKRGFISNTFTINFSISVEFWIAGLFYYFSKDVLKIGAISSSILTDNSIIPIFTMDLDYDFNLPIGWKLYKSSMYKVDSSVVSDEMDITTLFNTSLMESIKFHLEKNITVNTFIKISVMKDSERLHENEFTMDWKTMTLYTHKVNTTSTYRLFIHINPMYINQLISSIHGFGEEK